MGQQPLSRRHTPGWQILTVGLVDLVLAAALLGVLMAPGKGPASGIAGDPTREGGSIRPGGEDGSPVVATGPGAANPDRPEADAGSGAQVPVETVAEPATEAEAEPVTEAEAEAHQDADAEVEAQVEADAEAEAEAEAGAEIEVEPEAEVEAEPEAEVEAEVEAEIEAEVEAEIEADVGGEETPPTTISVYCKPWADFYVDGALVKSGNVLKDHPVEAGTHQVKLVCSVLDNVEHVFSVDTAGGAVNLGCWDFETMAPCS